MTDARTSTFVVADLLLGLPVDRVAEIVPGLSVVPVPLSHPAVSGLVNLRGRILTVMDCRARLGLPERSAQDAPGVHVIVTGAGAQVSLLVDSVREVVDITELAREDVPETVSPWIRSLTASAHEWQDELLLVLAADRLSDMTQNARTQP